MIGNDIDQGLLLVAVSIAVMFAFPLFMAWFEQSLSDPPRPSRGRPGPRRAARPAATRRETASAAPADAAVAPETAPAAATVPAA